MPESRRGFVLGGAAYGIWGLFPLYWPLLKPTPAVAILAHRVVWSLLTVGVVLLTVRRARGAATAGASRRTLCLLALAGLLIGVNWGTYIYGVNTGRVVETSLGYFINPLVTAVLAVVVLRERVRPRQQIALGLAALAVAGLTLDYGHPPWIALVLAVSFGLYGLVKKTVPVGALEGLAVEAAVLAPLAVAYLAVLTGRGSGASTGLGLGAGHLALLASTGPVTAVPLLCFAGAARRVPLLTLGLLQYLTPTMQFLLGVLVYDEPMPLTRFLGFAAVWAALALFTADAWRARRRATAPVPATA